MPSPLNNHILQDPSDKADQAFKSVEKDNSQLP